MIFYLNIFELKNLKNLNVICLPVSAIEIGVCRPKRFCLCVSAGDCGSRRALLLCLASRIPAGLENSSPTSKHSNCSQTVWAKRLVHCLKLKFSLCFRSLWNRRLSGLKQPSTRPRKISAGSTLRAEPFSIASIGTASIRAQRRIQCLEKRFIRSDCLMRHRIKKKFTGASEMIRIRTPAWRPELAIESEVLTDLVDAFEEAEICWRRLALT